MFFHQFFVEGLGCASYLIGCESQGVAAVIDPQRNVTGYLEHATRRGMKITHIIETHLHADHVSGNTELAARTGGRIYLHAACRAEFPHQPLLDGEIIQVGRINIQVLHTPGHTPDSILLLVSDTSRSPEPWLALTGDLLFVGDAGRPDLLGVKATRDLAGQLYTSLFEKIVPLNDGLLVYPGHGVGSLCGRSLGSVLSSSLGYEKRNNPALAIQGQPAFIEFMLHNLPEQPANHQRIKTINRRGAGILGQINPAQITLPEAIQLMHKGASILDTRSKEAYLHAHIPGSIHIPANEHLSNQVAYVLSPDLPAILLLESESSYAEVIYSLARVGYENVAGYLQGSIQSWQAAGLPVESDGIQDLMAAELNRKLSRGEPLAVVDVREGWEFAQGHIREALHHPLGQFFDTEIRVDPHQAVAIICAIGNRSQVAATLLWKTGYTKVYNVLDGIAGWQNAGLDLVH
jgi:hydroxyacylglutathione hydrolase